MEQAWACVLVDECGYERVELEVVGRTVGDFSISEFFRDYQASGF